MLEWLAAGDQSNDDDDSKHEKEMNERTSHMENYESEHPQDKAPPT